MLDVGILLVGNWFVFGKGKETHPLPKVTSTGMTRLGSLLGQAGRSATSYRGRAIRWETGTPATPPPPSGGRLSYLSLQTYSAFGVISSLI